MLFVDMHTLWFAVPQPIGTYCSCGLLEKKESLSLMVREIMEEWISSLVKIDH